MPKKKAKKIGKLSIQQRRFVNNVLEGMDAKNAYIKAGYTARGKSAEASASQLLGNPKVQPLIKEVQNKANKAAEITQQRIKDEESRLAFYDLKELFDSKGTIIPPHKLPKNIRQAIHGIEIIVGPLGETKYKYKFHEKGKALERLERIEGMNQPEKHIVDLEGKIEIINSYAIPDDEDTP